MNTRMLRILSQIVIGFILLYGHLRLEQHTILIRNPRVTGVPPVTEMPLPLTADDIARGLKANPNLQVDMATLTKAATLRTEYARLKSEHGNLRLALSTQSAAVLSMMESD